MSIGKGKYYHPSKLQIQRLERYKTYENNGVSGYNQPSNFSFIGLDFWWRKYINWSACLKTPKVRMEWFEDLKIDWAATDKYDKDMEHVLKKMHASDEY